MKNNQLKNDEGLPEIANVDYKNKKVMLFILISSLILIMDLYYYHGSKHKTLQPMDETYTVQTNEIPTQKTTTITAVPKVTPASEALSQAKLALAIEQQKALHDRLTAPLMVVSNNSANTAKNSTQKSVTSNDPNMQFFNQASNQAQDIRMASTIGPLNNIIAQGNLIHAILEPATNSDLPGFLRAMVSEAGYSEDGSQILIPRGSRLIGQYKSGMVQGQTRIFVVWTRLITPSGISIQLGSSGVDDLGVAGMGADEMDRHFWQRFGTASLLSIIGAGAANVGASQNDQDNSLSEYRTAVAESFSQSANQSLQHDMIIAPTLKTYQGKPIMVFVAHDLNFKSAIEAVKPNVSVF